MTYGEQTRAGRLADAASALLMMGLLLAGAAVAVFFAVTIFFSPGPVHGQAQTVPTPTPTPTPTATPTPEESAGAASESVQITGLPTNLTAPKNYNFTVRASSLDSTLPYRISIQTLARNIGFDELEEAIGSGEEVPLSRSLTALSPASMGRAQERVRRS